MHRWRMSVVALLTVCCFALRAAQDDEIKQLKEMIKQQSEMIKAQNAKIDSQNAKIEKLEKAQGAAATTASVDKAVASRGAAYLAPDKPEIKGTGLGFTGEFLYLKAQMGGNTVAYQGTYDTAVPTNGEAKNVNTDWAAGFRLGLDYRLPYDGWTLAADYTYYRAEGDLTAYGNDVAPLWVAYNQAFQIFDYDDIAVRSKAEFSYDRFNLELGRNSKLSETLSVRVHSRKMDISYEAWGQISLGSS